MIKAGIDAGAKFLKLVIMEDGKLLAKSMEICGTDLTPALNTAFDKALKEAGVSKDKIEKVKTTGVGGELLTLDWIKIEKANIVGAIAKSAVYFFPGARAAVDVGAEDCRVAKCNEKGGLTEFALNDKCAAGAGLFLEAVSRALEIKAEEMGTLSLKAEKSITMNTHCVVFAESEVVSLIHRKTPKEEIARASYDAISGRVVSLIRKIGINGEIVVCGGVARDAGFIASLKRKSGLNLLIPELPEFAGAIGACL
ncbi:MAG: hypothetical protein A2231_00405 [Candidatus Firestonebacteria bacterium RIFOXYA2_FULL_40_8]|nr:MAG: hypothetical protein A2231_00405 [Candidatus Firestonebacteria bacterium RIFOXYA2_FULL_40_8]